MTNEESIAGFQFEVSLPEGVTMTDCELSARKAADHQVQFTPLSNGNYQVIAYSGSNQLFSGTEGTLVSLLLSTEKELGNGIYEMSISNIDLSTPAGTSLLPADIIAMLTVSDVKIGDANGDGRISIADVVTVVNAILGNAGPGYVAEASDVNGDGRTSIADVVSIVNKILSGETTAKARMKEVVQSRADLLDPQ